MKLINSWVCIFHKFINYEIIPITKVYLEEIYCFCLLKTQRTFITCYGITCYNSFCILRESLVILTHLEPKFHFYTPWKHQKIFQSFFDVFMGYRSGVLVQNRLTTLRRFDNWWQINQNSIPYFAHYTGSVQIQKNPV